MDRPPGPLAQKTPPLLELRRVRSWGRDGPPVRLAQKTPTMPDLGRLLGTTQLVDDLDDTRDVAGNRERVLGVGLVFDRPN